MGLLFKKMLLIHCVVLMSAGVFANHSRKNIPYTLNYKSIDYLIKSKENSWLAEHLVSFNAAYSSRVVELHWNLANAKVIGHFNVERSLDGEKFEKIGEVDASTVVYSSYSFTDLIKPSVARKNDLYYRLEQVDGENASYSKVLIVRMYETRSVASISVTPDPAINDIQVNVQLKESSFVVMKVSSNQGEEIMRKTAKAGEGLTTYNLTGTSRLKPGNYKLEIIVNSNERMVMQLIKS